MIEFRTNLGRQPAREIIVPLDERSGLEPKWLLKFFEDAVARGQCFSANETVQIGWMLVMLKENDQHDLEIWEPQFDSIPIRWIRGANNTIRHLILQKSVADLFQVEPEFPSLRQAGIASQSFLTTPSEHGFRLARQLPEGNDSGWSFDTPANSGDMPEFRSLFELSFHHPEIVPFLALPSEAIVLKKGDQITISLREKTLNSAQNKFLQSLSSVSVWV